MTGDPRSIGKAEGLMALDEGRLQTRLLSHIQEADRISKALDLAYQSYEGQLRDEGTPYIRHPLRVALILIEEAGVLDSDLVCAALLHDVLEDHPEIGSERIRSDFGDRVASAVQCLTNEFKLAGLPKHEARRRYLDRITTQGSRECILLKLCDRLDNLRSVPFSTHADKRQYMVRETQEHFLRPFAEAPPELEAVLQLLRKEVEVLQSDGSSA